MLSMAAGAWQGTTAQTEPAGSASEHSNKGSQQLTLRGCVHKGYAAGSYVLVTRGAAIDDTGLEPGAAPAQDGVDAPRAPRAAPRAIGYELVAGQPEMDLAALVGKRVVAQGTPERTAPGATSVDGPGPAATIADSPADETPVGTSGETPQRSRVRITTIRPVAGSCE
jgi:hypothetical protein